jgi:hypothetical protein
MTGSSSPSRAPLFAQPAVEAVRGRTEPRHDLESRRATQALIDVGPVLNTRQRRSIASRLTDGPRPIAGFRHPTPASAGTN